MRLLHSIILSFALLGIAGRAEAGVVQPNPASVKFPDTGVGAQSADITVNFTNTSNNMAVTLASLTIIGANPGDFLIDMQALMFPPPVNMAPGFIEPVPVACKPTANGPRSAILEAAITNNGVVDVPLTCNGIGPKLTVTPNPLNAGGALVGGNTMTMFTIGNPGGGNIQISNITITGAQAAEFSVNLPNFPVVLGPANQGALMLTLSFNPGFQGNHSAVLNIFNDDPNFKPQVGIPILGKAGDPTITADSGTVGFPNTRVGLMTMPLTVNIGNSGNSDLHVMKVTLSGAMPGDFILDPGKLPGATIPIGGMVPFTVAFAPTMVGARAAAVVITSDDPNTRNKNIALIGNGTTSMLSIAPMVTLDFGQQQIYTSSKPQSVVFTNAGTDDAYITMVTASMMGQPTWFRTNGIVMPPIKIPRNNGTAKIDLVALPLGIGPGANTFTIATDDPKTPMFQVPLKVTGTGSSVVAMPNFADFGTVGVLASPKMTVMITNTGTAPLSIINFNVVDMTMPAPVFTVDDMMAFAMLPATIMPNKSVPLTVTFNPQAEGMYTGEIDLDTDDPMNRHLHIPLDGAAAQPNLQVMPMMLTFNNQPVNTASATQNVTITNSGNAPLTITSVTVMGPNAGAFMIVDPGVPFTLAGMQSRMVPVSFQPVTGGTATATLIVTPMGFNASQVKLMGTATTPNVKATTGFMPTNVLTFPETNVGVDSDALNVRLDVVSPSPSLMLTPVSSNSEFTIDTSGSKLLLNAGEHTTFNVIFRPGMTGARTAMITFTAAGVKGTVGNVIIASGTGIAAMVTHQRGCAIGGGRAAPTAVLLLLALPGALLVRRRRRRAEARA